MVITIKTTKSQVMRRMRELRKQYEVEEKRHYKYQNKRYKSGHWPFKPTPIKEQIINRGCWDFEYQELRAWLLGFKTSEKLQNGK